ncbi:S1/P1 nuclease [Mucilaginibacter angelicae]|uniref:S1/P1 nuclease n=1 Tax=Mucilaginibacter angelicae TaxID=869718 RepID=A0ABV6L5A3_9SPHI
MKNILILPLVVLTLSLISWGPEGHSIVATVADKHLTPHAKTAVTSILGGQSMASVSSWADATRNTTTAPWHFLNLSIGLNYQQFWQAATNLATPSVYSELRKLEVDIVNPATPALQKTNDLKYISHFISDAHQPMHTSRASDRGGNDIKLSLEGIHTDLHALWEGVLIKHKNSDYVSFAAHIDTATLQQIRQWQSDGMLQWLYESYQASSKLYTEVQNGGTVNEAYYTSHTGIVENRLKMGGIRLAGVLNKLFAAAH